MIRPHQTELLQKHDLDAQKEYEHHIDECISTHDFSFCGHLAIDDTDHLTLADRASVLAKYTRSYKIREKEDLAPGWIIEQYVGSVLFYHPLHRKRT